MKVLVCGGRDYADSARVFATLDFMADEARTVGDPIDAIIHGGASGADYLASAWAGLRGVETIPFPASWIKYGKAAGPIRNQQMIDEGKPDAVVAFPGGRGTADMVRRARAAGIPTKEMAVRATTSGPTTKETP